MVEFVESLLKKAVILESEEETATTVSTPTRTPYSTPSELPYARLAIGIVLLLMIALAIGIYFLLRRQWRTTEENDIEYTRAILGDDTFEFSQLDTI